MLLACSGVPKCMPKLFEGLWIRRIKIPLDLVVWNTTIGRPFLSLTTLSPNHFLNFGVLGASGMNFLQHIKSLGPQKFPISMLYDG